MHNIQWTDEKIRRLWGYYATNPAYQNQYFSSHSGKYILNYIERYLNLGKVQFILDFGCGPGYFIEHLIKVCSAGKCYGLDFSRESVDQVNKKFRNNPRFGKAIYADKLPSSLEGSSMELVVSIEVIEHLDDYQLSSMLKEIYRILKPEGYVVITTPNKEDLGANKTICPECGCIFNRWQHMRNWTISELTDLMAENGFRLTHANETRFTTTSVKTLDYLMSLLRRSSFRKEESTINPHLIYIGRK